MYKEDSTLNEHIVEYWPGSSQLPVDQEEKKCGLLTRIQVYGDNIDEACHVKRIDEPPPLFRNPFDFSETQRILDRGGPRLEEQFYQLFHPDYWGDGIPPEIFNVVSYRIRVTKRLAIFRAIRQRSNWEGYILAKVLNNDSTLNKLLKSGLSLLIVPKIEVRKEKIYVFAEWGYDIFEPSEKLLHALDLIAGHVRQLSKRLEGLPLASDERDIPDRYWGDILS